MKILVLDNYDSFTYNLVHLVREIGFGKDLQVHRNDKIELSEVQGFDKILLSPGPGVPSEAGIMPQLLKKYSETKSILGICLGHQAIGEAFGGTLENMKDVYHGVATEIQLSNRNENLFKGLPDRFKVCRYHSWTVVPETFPDSLEVTSVDENNKIMSLRHKKYDVRGLQFHPESILTEYGKNMMEQWLMG